MSAAAEKTPAKAKKATTPRKSKPVSNGNHVDGSAKGSADGGRASPTDSAKKLKIFHYFGGGGSAPEPTPEKRQRATAKAANASRVEDREAAMPRRVSDRLESPPKPAPTWGKLVDPRKKRRWDMLRRLQEVGGRGSSGVDPTAWARRSYSLGYTSIFQDGRVPGMGSTSSRGWASQSHVFGGARACLARNHPADSSSGTSLDNSRDVNQLPILGGCVGGEGGAGQAGATKSRHANPARGIRSLQSTNFKVMVTWLSSSYSPARPASTPSTSTDAADIERSLLEIALEQRDGGPAGAFMALMSLAPEALAEAEEEGGGFAGAPRDALALALRLYNLGSTWLRVARDPAPRQQGQGPGSRRHPNSPDLAAAVDEADERERQRRSTVEHAAALVLLNAGVAVSLADAAERGTARARCNDGVGIDGENLVDCDPGPDVLAALALSEAMAAAEVRSLAKTLGISSTVTPDRGESRGRWGAKAKGLEQRGSGGVAGSTVQSKDEACRAVEQWLTRPEDAAKRRSRLTRATREAAVLVRVGKGGKGEGGGENGVLVLRLTDDAREALHRVHVAFFAAARHSPHDVPAVLREDLERVAFGGADGGGSDDGSSGEERLEKAPTLAAEMRSTRSGSMHEGNRRPAPQVLSSVEAFAEYYRLVGLSDAMELAAGAEDAELAYGSLHEASTVLFPSGCPLCRRHLLRQRNPKAESGSKNEAALAPPPHCDICELSARVVMRGIGLMERNKDYDSAFHYLEILLQASSQRLSVYRPGYWVRLVTDLGHKKRATEALRACEKALAEACPLPGERPSHHSKANSSRGATLHPQGSGGSPTNRSSEAEGTAEGMTPVEEQAAAVLPLGESLPLQRRAVRLAVPPLRWRKRPPPELRQAQLRVMSLDLSWRHAGASGGSAYSTVPNGTGNPTGSLPRRRVEVEMEKEDEDEDVGEGGGFKPLEADKGEDLKGAGKIAPGTSLEQAVLDTMLEELGPGWNGLHSENSICLGLFALLCWDALFASPIPPAGHVPIPSPSDASAGVSPIATKMPLRQGPISQDPQSTNTTSNCDGEDDGRSTTTGDETSLESRHKQPIPSSASGPVSAGRELAWGGIRQRGSSQDEEGEDDTFHPFPSPFQSEPADLMTVAFAGRRRCLLEGLFARVERGEAVALIRQTWARHYGKACTGLNWNLFSDGVEGWATVASAIGPQPLSSVCRNLASNYWAWRHGLPDLFLWRRDAAARRAPTKATVPADRLPDSPMGVHATRPTSERPSVAGGVASTCRGPGVDEPILKGEAETKREACCKWVEVKGPGDSLSCAQEAWIDTLVGAGADFVLLRVEDNAVLPA